MCRFWGIGTGPGSRRGHRDSRGERFAAWSAEAEAVIDPFGRLAALVPFGPLRRPNSGDTSGTGGGRQRRKLGAEFRGIYGGCRQTRSSARAALDEGDVMAATSAVRWLDEQMGELPIRAANVNPIAEIELALQ